MFSSYSGEANALKRAGKAGEYYDGRCICANPDNAGGKAAYPAKRGYSRSGQTQQAAP